MSKLKKGSYFNKNEFVRHVAIILLGRFAYDGSTSVSFLEVAEYLNTTSDNLRMRKKQKVVSEMLESAGIKVKKICGVNHYYLINEVEEEVGKTIVI
jgi:hypothetical protein